MTRTTRGYALLAVLGVLLLAAVVHADDSVVNTSNGPVRGIVASTYRVFKGIPYAEPPVGPLRWRDPLPHRGWAPSTLNATEFGPGCPQRCVLPPHMCPQSESEDCLTLNIWTPRGASSSPRSVMFFMPGGRFEQGDSTSPLYSGEYFTTNLDVILVTTNYRLGVLGHLVTDEYAGNFAIKDQRMALVWLKKNIAAFGGNPNDVTIFGQSAGASSTAVHLLSPYSRGLFSKAIMESNPFALPMKTVQEGRDLGRKFVEYLHCPWNHETTDACLRSKSVNEVMAGQYGVQGSIDYFHPLLLFLPWTPIVDGKELTDQPWKLFTAGNFTKVPIMMGTVAEEALFFIYEASNGTKVSESLYVLLESYLFQLDVVEVLRKYPVGGIWDDSDYRPLLSTQGTDYIFVCPTRLSARGVAKTGVPTFLYQFNHVPSFDAWGKYTFCDGHVCHGIELPFVFHAAAPFYNFTAAEDDLSKRMSTYWTNFAKSGNPNHPVPVQPAWPAYTASADASMELATPPTVQTGLRASYCDFWDRLGYSHGM